MARGKVRIEYIESDSKRKTTLKRRLKSLIKKVNELSVLCNVMALLVVYRPGEKQAVVWPPMTEAIAIARDYKSINSEKLKKPLDGEGFVQQLVEKERTRLLSYQRANDTKRIVLDLCVRRDSLKLHGLKVTPEVVGQLGNLTLQLITDVQCKLQSTLRAASDRLKQKRSGISTSAPPQQQGMLPEQEMSLDAFFMATPPAAPPAPVVPMEMDPPHVADADPMTGLGSMVFDVLSAYDNGVGNGSVLLTPEELRDVLVRTGILTPPPPNDDSSSGL